VLGGLPKKTNSIFLLSSFYLSSLTIVPMVRQGVRLMVDGKNQTNSGDEDLEKIMQEINSIEQESAVQETSAAALPQNVKAFPKGEKTSQSLTMELNGSIQLRLVFASGARSMEISCDESGFICRLADGSEFRIPMGAPVRKTA
jgi:putative NADH-flavin reductase